MAQVTSQALYESNLGFVLLTSLSPGQYRKALVWNFTVKTLLFVNI